MPAVQIATVLIVLVFAVYLFDLLALDIVALILNAVLIFALLARLIKTIRKDLDNLCIAVALVVMLVMLIFRFPGFPIYKITWFLILTYAGSQAVYWAHRNGYVDLSGLVPHHRKR